MARMCRILLPSCEVGSTSIGEGASLRVEGSGVPQTRDVERRKGEERWRVGRRRWREYIRYPTWCWWGESHCHVGPRRERGGDAGAEPPRSVARCSSLDGEVGPSRLMHRRRVDRVECKRCGMRARCAERCSPRRTGSRRAALPPSLLPTTPFTSHFHLGTASVAHPCDCRHAQDTLQPTLTGYKSAQRTRLPLIRGRNTLSLPPSLPPPTL